MNDSSRIEITRGQIATLVITTFYYNVNLYNPIGDLFSLSFPPLYPSPPVRPAVSFFFLWLTL